MMKDVDWTPKDNDKWPNIVETVKTVELLLALFQKDHCKAVEVLLLKMMQDRTTGYAWYNDDRVQKRLVDAQSCSYCHMSLCSMISLHATRPEIKKTALKWIPFLEKCTRERKKLYNIAHLALVRLQGPVSDQRAKEIINDIAIQDYSQQETLYYSHEIELLVLFTFSPVICDYILTTDLFKKLIKAYQPVNRTQAQLKNIDLVRYNAAVEMLCADILLHILQLPPEDAETEAMAKLAQMSLGPNQEPKTWAPLRKKEAVLKRAKICLDLGVAGTLRRLGSSGYRYVRDCVATCWLTLVTNPDLRRSVVAAGAYKSLISIISRDQPTNSCDAFHAVCKILIMTQPEALLEPPIENSALPCIYITTTVIQDSKTTDFQLFEALMALTNLASIHPSMSPPIASKLRMFSEIDNYLFHQHRLVRRAAVQLACNCLNGSQKILERFISDNGAGPRLQLLLFLCQDDDKPTALAAGGALAIIAQDPRTSTALLKQVKMADCVSIIEEVLEEEDEGMALRMLTILLHIDAKLDTDQRSTLTNAIKRHTYAGLQDLVDNVLVKLK